MRYLPILAQREAALSSSFVRLMRFLLLNIFIYCLPFMVLGQFVEVWGTAGDEAVHGILSTLDGGYIVYGLTDGSGEGQDDFMLIKYDTDGSQVWAYTYGTYGKENGHAVGLDEMPNGDLYLSGVWEEAPGNPDRGIITKLDGNGQIIWTRMLVGEGLYYGDGFHQVKQMPDGDLLAAGWSQSTTTGNQDSYLMKFSPDGGFIGDLAFGGGFPDHTLDMVLDEDGFFLAHSGDTLGPGVGAVGLARIDYDLQLIWNKMYGSSGDESLGEMVLRPDGTFMLFGRSVSGVLENSFVSLLDSEGTLIWTRTIDAGSGLERINDAVFLSDGSYIISMTSLSLGRVVMTRFDDQHQVLWAKISPFGTSSEVEYRSENQIINGNEVLCATDIEGIGFGGYDIEVDRYDPEFGPCDWEDIELDIELIIFQEEEIAPDETSGGSLIDFELFRNDLTFDTLSISDCFIDYCQFEGELEIPNLCQGDQGTFIYTLTDAPPGTLTWEWQIDGEEFDTEQAIFTASASGTLPVSLLIISDEIPDCAYEVDSFFQVTATPQFEISGPDSLCAGILGDFQVDNVVGNVLWSNGFIGPEIEASFDDDTVLEVTMEVGECQTSESMEIIVTQFPSGSIGGPEMICLDDQLTFSVEGNYEQLVWGNGETDETISIVAGGDSMITVSMSNASCYFEDSYPYSVLSPAEIFTAMELELCEGIVHQLYASGGEEYIWSNGSTGSSTNYLVLTDSTVWVQGFNSCGGEIVEINIEAVDSAFDGQDTLSYTGEIGAVQLINLPDPLFFNVYLGSELICESCSDFLIEFQKDVVYTLVAENEFGCVLTSFVEVNTLPCTDIYVPSSFTPNNDGVNDRFGPVCRAACIDSYEMKIYDRWGQEVFDSRDVAEKWLGDGVYSEQYYVADEVYTYRMLYSLTDSFDVIEKIGSITILR